MSNGLSFYSVIAANLQEGSAANEFLTGGSGDDFLRGLGGRDTLLGGAGNDTLDGGDGLDIAVFALPGNAIGQVIRVEAGLLTAADQVDTLINVERVEVNGSSGADTIYGSDRDESLDGGQGDDVLYGGGGRDVLIGRNGLDRMTGGAGHDVFIVHPFPDDTSDIITDFATGDRLVFQSRSNGGEYILGMIVKSVGVGNGAGLGSGQVHVQEVDGGVIVRAGIDDRPGFDTSVMLQGNFSLNAFFSAGVGVGYGQQPGRTTTSNGDLLRGTAYDDTLNGGAGNDSIAGVAGADQVDGGRGVDAYSVGNRFDELDIRHVSLARPGEVGFVSVDPLGWGGIAAANLYNVELLVTADRVLLLTGMDQAVSASLPLGFSEKGTGGQS